MQPASRHPPNPPRDAGVPRHLAGGEDQLHHDLPDPMLLGCGVRVTAGLVGGGCGSTALTQASAEEQPPPTLPAASGRGDAARVAPPAQPSARCGSPPQPCRRRGSAPSRSVGSDALRLRRPSDRGLGAVVVAGAPRLHGPARRTAPTHPCRCLGPRRCSPRRAAHLRPSSRSRGPAAPRAAGSTVARMQRWSDRGLGAVVVAGAPRLHRPARRTAPIHPCRCLVPRPCSPRRAAHPSPRAMRGLAPQPERTKKAARCAAFSCSVGCGGRI